MASPTTPPPPPAAPASGPAPLRGADRRLGRHRRCHHQFARRGIDGLPWFKTTAAAPPLAPGDVVSITQTQTAGTAADWTVPAGSSGYVALNTSDPRPGSPGLAAAELTVQASAPTEIDQYFDGLPNVIAGGKFLPVNGAWQLSFWARTTSGTATLEADFLRGASTGYFVTEKESLTTDWQQFVLSFTATDDGPPNPLALRFLATGTAGTLVHLDDVQLGRVSDGANPWRAEVIQNLQQLQPGYLRDLELQLGDTLQNRLAPAFARSPQRWEPDPTNQEATYLYGLPDFLSLCRQIGAQPWIVVPDTFYDAEFTQLGQYLAAAQGSYNFKEIVVEFGNENWNSGFRPASIPDPPTMGAAANRGFGLLRSAAGPAVPLHLVVNSALRNPQVGQLALLNAPQADAVDVNAYFFNTLNTADTQQTALSAMFDQTDEATYIPQLQNDAAGKDVDAYEVNLKTTDGDVRRRNATRWTPGWYPARHWVIG